MKHANQEFFEEAKRLKMKIVFAWGTGPDANWHKLMADRLLRMGFTYRISFHGLLRDEFFQEDIPPAEGGTRETEKLLPEAQFMAELIYLLRLPAVRRWKILNRPGLVISSKFGL